MNLGKRSKPTESPEMHPSIFGRLVALLADRGYNPSEIIGTSDTGRSRMDIFEAIKEKLNERI